ncbi:MAG TPA: hypothetical protein VGW75_06820 [Solirubrobacteraceae bacterium]|nr:hypothetical protein [Solirubrobacteraceae bacterium]
MVLLCAGAPEAAAVAQRATLLAPADGSLTSSPQENPPHHTPFDGDWAVDVAGAVGRPVFARFSNVNGALALRVVGHFEPCASPNQGTAGVGLRVQVIIEGVVVGVVNYAHLANPHPAGEIANGQQIGTMASGSSTSCWSGPHVHMEPRNEKRYACFQATPLNSTIGAGTKLGVIGGEFAAGRNQLCPSGAVDDQGSTADGSFVRTPDGATYRMVGGAPVYVSTWDAFGGPQPVTYVSPETFSTFRAVPADGTFVTALPGAAVYRVAGGAPIYIPSWDVYGGAQPTIGIDKWAVDHAADPISHLRPTPADGTLLKGLPSQRFWRIAGGRRSAVAAAPGAVELPDAAIDPFPVAAVARARTIRRTVKLRRGCSPKRLRVSGRGVRIRSARRVSRRRCRLTLRVAPGLTGRRDLLVRRGGRTLRRRGVIRL